MEKEKNDETPKKKLKKTPLQMIKHGESMM
jgi:hypothetical protein